MDNPLDNHEICDSRDIIEYQEYLEEMIVNELQEKIEEIEEEIKDYQSELDEALEEKNQVLTEKLEELISSLEDSKGEWTIDEFTKMYYPEYIDLMDFISQAESSSDWVYGEAIISEDYFVEYTKDFIISCGYIDKTIPDWIEIDWEKTSENIAQDFFTVEYNDSTYYIRN